MCAGANLCVLNDRPSPDLSPSSGFHVNVTCYFGLFTSYCTCLSTSKTRCCPKSHPNDVATHIASSAITLSLSLQHKILTSAGFLTFRKVWTVMLLSRSPKTEACLRFSGRFDHLPHRLRAVLARGACFVCIFGTVPATGCDLPVDRMAPRPIRQLAGLGAVHHRPVWPQQLATQRRPNAPTVGGYKSPLRAFWKDAFSTLSR
ncbi:unnamed protein product [Protopolystoma xenopodis]|uniref:Uncharacterized protein n=1 Tax=Protopolystoma xenopodis TaxID=117903 RepID=A0A448X6J3_9PLAT|nr:unnamed protein product [Protopolystoma xenopodis]